MNGRLLAFVFVLVSCAAAQINFNRVIPRVRVRVSVQGGGCVESAHVVLQGEIGSVAQGTTNEHCEVDFFNVPEGSYYVNVSGANLGSAAPNAIKVESAGTGEYEVEVRRPESFANNLALPTSAFISASELGVPGRARKELERANELIYRQEYPPAIQKLHKALSIYPCYALAYNNLGVIYGKLQDPEHERAAFEKAIRINDHFALAFINLGRMNIAAANFPDAETALTKAVSVNPTDAIALILLSWANLMDQHFDDAISASRQAHTLKAPHASIHRVAARAFEKKRDWANAIVELELFVKEEAPGPRADSARQELQTVKAWLQQS